MYIYKVVGVRGKAEIFESVEELTSHYEQDGSTEGSWLKQELQGQPRLKGLLGAMYDGMSNGKHVIRYETQEMYDILSR